MRTSLRWIAEDMAINISHRGKHVRVWTQRPYPSAGTTPARATPARWVIAVDGRLELGPEIGAKEPSREDVKAMVVAWLAGKA
jgi:hypothetical protein